MTDAEFYAALVTYKNGKCEPLHETVAVLSYEVGRMLEQAMYLKWHSDDPIEQKVRRGLLKSELIDARAQLILIEQAMGIEDIEVRELGIEKAMERFTGREVKHG